MAIVNSDIQFFLSGGGSNPNANLSLGGQPSSFPLTGGMNSLFSNVTTEQAFAGKIDYRCFYVFNKSETDTLYESEIYFEDQGFGGSAVTIGLQKTIDLQKISVSGPVTGGGLTLLYGSLSVPALWLGSAAGFETDLQTKLRTYAPGTKVSTEPKGNNYEFAVSFEGDSANKSHPLLRVASGGNTLTGPDSPIVSISKTTDGSPINSVAPLLSLETVPPARVSFLTSDRSARIQVGTLGPGDGFPVWIRRVTNAGAEYMENDYFAFRITGRPF